MDIYESLINGNKRYGSNKDHICESNFKCKSSEINEKVIRYMFDVNFFLIETYRNLLLKIYENKKISINELFYLYQQFMENINMLLDIDLPMDKDVLRSNINDTDFMHMIKIRKLI